MMWANTVVSTRPDRELRKQILKQGDYNVVPYEDSRCRVKVTEVLTKHEKGPCGIDPNSRIFSSYFDGTVLIGDCDGFIDKDIEVILQHMCRGEICSASLLYRDARGAFAKEIMCKIELVDLTEEQLISDWGPERLFEAALHHKEMGVQLFHEKRVADSFRRFNKALKMLIAIEPLDPATNTEDMARDMMDLKVKLYNNLAHCQLQFDEYGAALDLCNKALVLDPENAKTLYKRCVSNEGLNLYEDAWKDIQHALTLQPNNKLSQQKALALKPKIEKINKEYANVIKKMFA